MLLNRSSSLGFIETFLPNPTLCAARLMNETRLEYMDSWIDWVRVMEKASFARALARMRLMMVAFIPNLIQSRGMNHTMFWKEKETFRYHEII